MEDGYLGKEDQIQSKLVLKYLTGFLNWLIVCFCFSQHLSTKSNVEEHGSYSLLVCKAQFTTEWQGYKLEVTEWHPKPDLVTNQL